MKELFERRRIHQPEGEQGREVVGIPAPVDIGFGKAHFAARHQVVEHLLVALLDEDRTARLNAPAVHDSLHAWHQQVQVANALGHGRM